MRVRRPAVGRLAHGAGDLEKDVRSAEVVRGDSRTPRGQVGPASEAEVERLEPFRSVKEQRGRLVAVARHGGSVAAKERGSRAMEAVERSAFCRGQQPLRRLEVAGLEARLRGGQRAAGLEGRVGGQRGRALEKGRCGREPAAALRSSCGALEVGGHGLVRSGGGECAVPRATVGGELGIARLRQRDVRAPSFVG